MKNSLPSSLLLFLSLFLFCFSESWAIKAEANISAQETGVGEPVQLTVVVTTQKKIDGLPWPTVQGQLDVFKVQKNQTTSSSSQVSIVNGRVTKNMTYVTNFTYELVPKKAGTFTIGPISYKHKDYQRNLGQTKITVKKTEPGVRLITSLSKRDLYVGEQFRYNLRIVPKNTVQNIQAPDFQKNIGKSFWMKQLDEKINAKVETIDGQQRRVFDVRFALFPLLSGPTTLEGIPIEYEERISSKRRQRSMFSMFEDDFFGGRVVKKTVHSKSVSIQAKALPGNEPKNFTGAVGQYTLKAAIDKNELASGDALTLRVEISGNGLPKKITKPALPDGLKNNFEIYPPETKSTTSIKGGYLHTYKSFKFVLIPQRKGKYDIQPIVFPYFNPLTKRYENAQSKSISVHVTKGKEAPQSRIITQQDIERLGRDIRHIKKSPAISLTTQKHLYQAPWYWGLFFLPPVIYLSLLLYRRRSSQLQSDEGLRRRVSAKGVARQHLAQARAAMQGDDSKTFYHTLMVAVERFVSNKLNIEFRGLTSDAAMQTLANHMIPDTIRYQYKELMDVCDLGLFANSEKDPDAWQAAYNDAEALINQLSKVV